MRTIERVASIEVAEIITAVNNVLSPPENDETKTRTSRYMTYDMKSDEGSN